MSRMQARPSAWSRAFSRAGRAPMLLVLFLVACLNLLDRHIIYVLQQPIKHDLGLSDAQLGAVGGLAFATVYCLAAFPIARLADTGKRTRIVALSVIFWSTMTGLTAFAGQFATLVICRMGVAAGEAGSVPASHSLISDRYAPHERSFAFSLWSLSQPLGVMMAYLAGGWLVTAFGWRGTLAILGVSGLALAPIILWLKEPSRGALDIQPPVPSEAPDIPPSIEGRSMLDVAALFYAIKPLRFLLIASALHAVVLLAAQSWSAGFYSRSFGMPVGQVAFYMAIVIGLAGGLGTLGGGLLAKRLSLRDRRWYLWLPAMADLLLIPVVATQFLTDDLHLSLGLGFAGVVLLSVFQVSSLVVAQTLAPADVRARVTASLQFIINLTAVALAPVLIGQLSDWIALAYGVGQESLRYAVTSSLVLAPIAAFFWMRSAATLDTVPASAALGR